LTSATAMLASEIPDFGNPVIGHRNNLLRLYG
jgi:hypothetical protein